MLHKACTSQYLSWKLLYPNESMTGRSIASSRVCRVYGSMLQVAGSVNYDLSPCAVKNAMQHRTSQYRHADKSTRPGTRQTVCVTFATIIRITASAGGRSEVMSVTGRGCV